MAKSFSVKEARQLIEKHRELLASLAYMASKAAGMRTEIKLSANALLTQSTLKRLILSDCNSPVESPAKCPEVERLTYLLCRYQRARSAIDTAQAFQDQFATRARQCIEALNPGPVGLAWLFSGKSAKENVAKAYQELTGLLNESYGQMIPRIVLDLDASAALTVDAAWDAFVSEPYSFSDTLKELCAEVFSSSGSSPFQALFSQWAELEGKISQCQTVTDKEREQIKAAADKVMAFNALQILSEVPVEEINRERGGFRAKTLRDAGYTTMADIYAAAPYQLAALHGVSDNAAYAMKHIAKQLLEEAREGVKIKLNADDRSKQATELVRSIYTYRLKNIARDGLDKLLRENRPRAEQAKGILTSVGSGMPWLFYSEVQREDVRASYTHLNTLAEGEYAKNVTALTATLSAEGQSVTAETAWDDFQLNNIEYISILEDIVPGALGNDDSLYGLPEELAREIQEELVFPDGLLCTLRRYQEWGVKYILHQKKVLLGDEMGLGKTVQAIATMVSLRNTGATHFMVVCPASVVTNWCREVAKHSKLRVTKIHGPGRSQALKSWVKTGGVAVTTYETTAYIKNDSVEEINLLVVDEAHYIKNPEARRSINVRRLCDKAERLLFMTGTALENKVEEMVSLIDVLQPQVATSVQSMTFMPNAPQFRHRVAPVYYRRKREDVLTELPDLIESKEWCVMNPEERAIYESNVLDRKYAASRRLSWDADDMKKSCKATRLLEIIEQAEAEERKVLVFSFFLDTIRTIGGLLGTKCYGPINGSVPPSRRQEIIDAFDEAPAGSVLLAQIQSGGTGLNIQSASVVVICEPQFKPSIENQAISRAYRMGQARNVLVYRLLCENTIDEKIAELLEYKQEVFDAFADKSVAAEQSEAHMEEVDEKKFGQLIQEEIDRINAEKERRAKVAK